MSQVPHKDLEKKINETLEISRELEKKIAKIYYWHRVRQIYFWLKILVIFLIIISAWIYVPPFLRKIAVPYQEAIGSYQNIIGSFGNSNQPETK